MLDDQLDDDPSQEGVFNKAFRSALGGGVSGAIAGAVQVIALMWLRTIVNYQYRHGTKFLESMRTLYSEGGIGRLYQGLGFALIQGPLAKFGATAANDGFLSLFRSVPFLQGVPYPIQTGAGSIVNGLWRVALMPLDTCKTVMQVEGRRGFRLFLDKVLHQGQWPLLYTGSVSVGVLSAVGHYPWFLTFNVLDRRLPPPHHHHHHHHHHYHYHQGQQQRPYQQQEKPQEENQHKRQGRNRMNTSLLPSSSSSVSPSASPSVSFSVSPAYLPSGLWTGTVRSAVIGFTATVVSDAFTNVLRVIKTNQQSNAAGVQAHAKTKAKAGAEAKANGSGSIDEANARATVNRSSTSNSGSDSDDSSSSSSSSSGGGGGGGDDDYERLGIVGKYKWVVAEVVRQDGGSLRGLFLRGLGARLLGNGLQSVVFTIVWKRLRDRGIDNDRGRGRDTAESQL